MLMELFKVNITYESCSEKVINIIEAIWLCVFVCFFW